MENDLKQIIYEVVIAYIQEHGYSPSFREIAEYAYISSTSTVQKYVNEMIAEGIFETDGKIGASRALRVPGYAFIKWTELDSTENKQVSKEELIKKIIEQELEIKKKDLLIYNLQSEYNWQLEKSSSDYFTLLHSRYGEYRVNGEYMECYRTILETPYESNINRENVIGIFSKLYRKKLKSKWQIMKNYEESIKLKKTEEKEQSKESIVFRDVNYKKRAEIIDYINQHPKNQAIIKIEYENDYQQGRWNLIVYHTKELEIKS